jgi:transposase-like protein
MPATSKLPSLGLHPDTGSHAARKLLYLAITRAQQKWRHTYNWSTALTAFRIHFGDRIPDNANLTVTP